MLIPRLPSRLSEVFERCGRSRQQEEGFVCSEVKPEPDYDRNEDFQVPNSPFAMTLEQLTTIFRPRSETLSEFLALGGTEKFHTGLVKWSNMRATIARLELKGPFLYQEDRGGPYSRLLDLEHLFIGSALHRSNNQPNNSKHAVNVTRNFLPVIADGQVIDAVPDSMSCANVITEEYANLRELYIDDRPTKRRVFVNAVGTRFESIGETRLLLSYETGVTPRVFVEKFAVVKECAARMVLGQPFLKKHEIFTRFRHCLKKVALPAAKSWRLMHMDLPCQKFICRIEHENIPVSIDTGSEKSFFALGYARRRGWHPKPLREDEGFVELADGTVIKASGYIDKMINIGGGEYRDRFYVLEGLMSDVLLGDELLDRVDFYNEIEVKDISHLWVDSEEFNEFHAITWLDKIEDHVSKFLDNPTYQVPDRGMQELMKRVQNPGGVSSLSQSTKRWRWWSPESRRRNRMDKQYQFLHSGIWTKLERLDNTESEARRKAEGTMSGVSGDDLRTLQDADAARRKRHEDERARLRELRTKLLEWNKNRTM